MDTHYSLNPIRKLWEQNRMHISSLEDKLLPQIIKSKVCSLNFLNFRLQRFCDSEELILLIGLCCFFKPILKDISTYVPWQLCPNIIHNKLVVDTCKSQWKSNFTNISLQNRWLNNDMSTFFFVKSYPLKAANSQKSNSQIKICYQVTILFNGGERDSHLMLPPKKSSYQKLLSGVIVEANEREVYFTLTQQQYWWKATWGFGSRLASERWSLFFDVQMLFHKKRKKTFIFIMPFITL